MGRALKNVAGRRHLLVQGDQVVVLGDIVLDGLHLRRPQLFLVLLPVLLGIGPLRPPTDMLRVSIIARGRPAAGSSEAEQTLTATSLHHVRLQGLLAWSPFGRVKKNAPSVCGSGIAGPGRTWSRMARTTSWSANLSSCSSRPSRLTSLEVMSSSPRPTSTCKQSKMAQPRAVTRKQRPPLPSPSELGNCRASTSGYEKTPSTAEVLSGMRRLQATFSLPADRALKLQPFLLERHWLQRRPLCGPPAPAALHPLLAGLAKPPTSAALMN